MRNRVTWMGLLLGTTLLLGGCYGPFKLTKKVHRWNGEVGNEWVNEAVFLGFVIIPVYGVATLVDAIVLNSIEFWTGDNPVSEDSGSLRLERDDVAVISQPGDDHGLHLRIERSGETVGEVVLLEGQPAQLLAPGGELLATAETLPDGSVVVRDAEGTELEVAGNS